MPTDAEQPTADRDREIRALRRGGSTTATLQARYGLTLTELSKILVKAKPDGKRGQPL